MLFSHPKDFTPVCTTELGAFAKRKSDFDARNVRLIGLSVDPLGSHEGWSKDIEETQGAALNYPLIADPERKIAELYDMIHPNVSETVTVRSVRVAAGHRLAAAHRELQRVDAGELEGRGRRHHRPRHLRRGRQGQVPEGVEGTQAVPPAHPAAEQVTRGSPAQDVRS
jgi:peroxiredoxin